MCSVLCYMMDLSKLEPITTEYEELTQQLSSSELTQNPSALKRVSIRHAELTPIIESIQTYKQTLSQLTQAQELTQSEDSELAELATADVESLTQQMNILEHKLTLALIPPDPNDTRNAIMEIRAGAGGDEASLFAAQLARMYVRFAETQRIRVETMSSHTTEVGGIKELILQLSGDQAYKRFKYESGVHRVQRVPSTEKSGRIHTSTVTIAVLPEAEEVDIHIDPNDLEIDVYRSSGPGGQSVNTTDSAVRITHKPTGMIVTCQDEKSQHKNKEKALSVLRARLLQAEQEAAAKERGEARKSQIGRGDRSEKIRTYNIPQDRVTDHRIPKTWNGVEPVLNGELEAITQTLQEEDIQRQLANMS